MMNPQDLLQALTDLSKNSLRHKENENSVYVPYYCESIFKPKLANNTNTIFFTITERNPAFLRTQHVLNQIKSLEANWDNYQAVAPSYNAIFNAENFLRKVPIEYLEILDTEYIYPNPNGTLSIEWRKDSNVVSIEFGEKTANFFSVINKKVAFRENIENIGELVPQEILDALSIFINS